MQLDAMQGPDDRDLADGCDCVPYAAELDLSGFGLTKISKVGKGHTAKALVVREDATSQLFVAKCVALSGLTEHCAALAQQEVLLLQSLKHRHVVAYHDSFIVEEAGTLVILVEYCDGGDLLKLIREKALTGEYFSEDQIMRWFVQVALALQYIHSRKVLHRDVKTSNIFLDKAASTVKLGDFGTSRILESTLDVAATFVGTPYYMSPELCLNESYSWKSDVWSLGCVLYQLCTLHHPFESSSLVTLAQKIINGDYDPIPTHYSQELRGLVRHLLSKSAELRPSLDGLFLNPYVRLCRDRLASGTGFSLAPPKTPPGSPPLCSRRGGRLPPLSANDFRNTIEAPFQTPPKSPMFETCLDQDLVALIRDAVALD